MCSWQIYLENIKCASHILKIDGGTIQGKGTIPCFWESDTPALCLWVQVWESVPSLLLHNENREEIAIAQMTVQKK